MTSRNIFLEMEQLKDLSPSERNVISYILENPQDVCEMSIVELGANSYTSASTVSRVCKKCNCDGYTQFKQYLCRDINSYNETVYMNKNKMPVRDSNTLEGLIDEVILNTNKAISEVKLLNSKENFQKAIHYLQKSKKVTIYGSGVSNLISHDAMIKGLRMGLNIQSFIYYSEMAMAARLSTPEDLGIIVSYTGKTTEMIKIAKILNLNKVPSISITTNSTNKIVKECELNLFVGNTESIYRIGGVESRMSIQCILDIIFTGYYNQTKKAKDMSETTFIEDTFKMDWK